MPSEGVADATRATSRAKSTAELLSTEMTFVSEMQILVEVFVNPLRRWAADMEAAAEAAAENDSPVETTPPIASADVAQIFANVEQLLGFNKQFLDDLKDANDRGTEDVIEVFLKAAPFFKMYSSYINNFDKARARLAALEARNPSLSAFIAACEAQRACHGLRLRDFLIQPVQRIPRYRLLLETMLKYTPEEDPSHAKLGRALASMSTTADKINADVHLMEKRAKVLELQDEFGTALVQASRLFVRDGTLFKICRNGPRQLRFLLFNDLLVYGEELGVFRGMLGNGERRYKAKRAIALDTCFVVDSPAYGRKDSSPMGEAGFMIVSPSKSFIVQASGPAEKDSWVQSLRGCMDELLVKTQERVKHFGDSQAAPLGPGRRGSGGSSGGHQDHNFTVWVINRENKPARQGYALPPAARQKKCGCLNFNELSMRRISDSGPGNGVAGNLSHAAAGLGASASSVFSSVGGLSIGSRSSVDTRHSLGRRTNVSTAFHGLGGTGGMPGDGMNSRDDSDYGEMSPRSVLNIAAMVAAAEASRGDGYSGSGGAAGKGKRPSIQQLTVRVLLQPGQRLGLRLRDVAGGGVVVVGYALAEAAAAAAMERPGSGGGGGEISPAAAAGVEPGDRIASVGSSFVESCEQLQGAVRCLQQTASDTGGGSGGSSSGGQRAVSVVLGLLRGFEPRRSGRERSNGSMGSLGGSNHSTGTAPWLVTPSHFGGDGTVAAAAAAASAAAAAASKAGTSGAAALRPPSWGLPPRTPPMLDRGDGSGSADGGGGGGSSGYGGDTAGVTPSPPRRRTSEGSAAKAAAAAPSVGGVAAAPVMGAAPSRTSPSLMGAPGTLPDTVAAAAAEAGRQSPPPVPQRHSLSSRSPGVSPPEARLSTRKSLPPPVPPFVGVGTTPETSPLNGGAPFANGGSSSAITNSSPLPPKPPQRGSSLEETRRLSARMSLSAVRAAIAAEGKETVAVPATAAAAEVGGA